MTVILIRTPSTIILVHDKIYVASVLKCIGRAWTETGTLGTSIAMLAID
jgi:hypothetical protein